MNRIFGSRTRKHLHPVLIASYCKRLIEGFSQLILSFHWRSGMVVGASVPQSASFGSIPLSIHVEDLKTGIDRSTT